MTNNENDTILKPYVTTPEDAQRIAEWLRTRGGIAIWESLDLNRPGESITTPVNTSTGNPAGRPAHWVDKKPARIITSEADVFVSKDVEVRRFHVAVRAGGNGMIIKCSDGASRRIKAAVAKAGEGAYHVFDYMAQEAVIFKPASQIPLAEYLLEQPVSTP